MDTILAAIADYTQTLRFSDLTTDAVHHCKRTLIDTFGCALGAFDAEPCRNVMLAITARQHSFDDGGIAFGQADTAWVCSVSHIHLLKRSGRA